MCRLRVEEVRGREGGGGGFRGVMMVRDWNVATRQASTLRLMAKDVERMLRSEQRTWDGSRRVRRECVLRPLWFMARMADRLMLTASAGGLWLFNRVRVVMRR